MPIPQQLQDPSQSSVVQQPDDDLAPLIQQMSRDGSLTPSSSGIPMRAVVAIASTMNPDAEAKTQKLAQRAGMGVDLTRHSPQVAQQRAVISDLDQRDLEIRNPILARQLQDPNFAGVAHDDLDSLSRIEHGTAEIRAWTPNWRQKADDALQRGFEFMGGSGSLKQKVFEFPAVRLGVDTLAGTEDMLGNIGSFFGIHGANSGPNVLQRSAQSIAPDAFGSHELGVDQAARSVGPMIPTIGIGAAIDTLGLSANAARVLNALGAGAAFTADQGGRTFTEMAAAGKSDAQARRAANIVAGINAVPNLAMGLTDFVPAFERNPLLTALGVGGATGAVGQFAQNEVTGQRWDSDLAQGAIEGAAMQGGMHLGFGFLGRLGEVNDAVDASKLRTRQPEAFQQYLHENFEGNASLRIPSEDFVNYFMQQKIDPAVVANHLGVTNLEEAAAAGSDLEIPQENFFGRLDPEHRKALLPDVIDPSTELTARQAEAGTAELRDWAQNGGAAKLAAEFAQTDAETQATPEWQQVQSDLKQRYMDAGESEDRAEGYATMNANAIAYLAKNSGMKPDELLALHNPQVTVGEAPNSAPVLHQQAIEDIRSVVEAARQPGHAPQKAAIRSADPWLVQAARENGLDLAGHTHVIDGSAVRHVINRHSDEKIERSRGQIALNDADFERIPEMLASPDAVVFGTKTKGKREQIGYIKRLEDGTSLYLEEVRTGKKELAAVSMRKYPATKDFDAIAGTLPSNAQGDGGTTPIIVRRPAPDKNETDLAHSVPLYQSDVEGNTVTRLFHGSEVPGRYDGPAWFSTNRDYAANYRPYAELQYVDYPSSKLKELGWDPENQPTFNVELHSDETGPRKTVGVNTSLQPRGWFRMLPSGAVEIGKTKLGDLSTFIHEPAHAYLELFRELSSKGEVSPTLKGDFRKICEWLGTTPEEVEKNGFTREQHEQWARGNEQYVREGEAPTSGLRRAFQGFSIWLQRIYRQASALGVELSDDIRGVMDRLYAGDAAIERAEREAREKRLFEKPEDAGWSEAEYRNYAEARDVQVDEARAQVARELNEVAEREQAQEYREEKRNVRDAMTEQIDARPEYTAIRSLRRGSLDDETPLTLSREALVEQFGEDRVRALQKVHRGIYRNEGGTDAETAAEIFGFGSGEEMMRALEAAPRRAVAIEAATRDYLVNKYGDVRYDGTLNDRARFALENKERAANIYREAKALKVKVARLEKKVADAKEAMASIEIAPLEQYHEAARQMVDQKAIADLQPHRYLDASRKYSREAFDALRSGNVRKAAEAKNKELLNHFLFREASAARDYVEKFERYVQRAVQSKGIQQRLGLADQQAQRDGRVGDYRDQFNRLLARYGLKGVTPEEAKGLMQARPLRDWAAEMQDEGNDTAIAEHLLNDASSASYRSIPLHEVRDLHDAVVNIRHLAQREFKMFVQGKQVAFAEAKTAMIEAARENLRTKPESIFDENRTVRDRIGDGLRFGDALLVRMERLIEWLDGGKSGPWHDNLWNLASDAQGDEYDLQHNVTQAVTDALADMPDEMRRRLWSEKVNVEGVPEPLLRRRMLSIAFNMGNAGNLDRLSKTFESFGWDPAAIRRIGGMLTHEEWSFVQKAWDSLKPLGERMAELEKRLTGLPPSMVKVTPFKVKLAHGEEMDLAGGYFPIVMDPRFSQRAVEQDSRETAQNAMQSGYVRATTSRGYTKERTGFGGPLLLDYERAMTSHVAKVVKDLSHREFMLSSQRFLLDTEVRRTLRETLGPAYEEQFMPWLRTIINDRNGSIAQGLGRISDAMQTMRSNIVAASVGFKASTLMLQITHAPRMMLYAKPGSLAQALVNFLAHPFEETRAIHELSPNEMRFRGDSLDRDLRGVLQEPSYKNGYAKKVAAAARFSLATVDHLLSHTLWRAAYSDALEKYADLSPAQASSKAVHEADSAVRLGLNSQAAKDLPAIMRNNDFTKMITTLYGFHNGVYNQLRDLGHQYRYDRSLGGIGKLTYGMVLTAVVPSLLGSLFTGDGPKDGENPGLWAAKKALLFSFDTVPILGGVANLIASGRDMQFSPIESVMEQSGKAVVHATTDKGDKDWLGIGLDAVGSAGQLLGIPGSQQVVKTLRYIHRANQGKVENPNVWNAIVGGGR